MLTLLSIAPAPVAAQSEDATSAAEDAAVTTATEQAASQAASEAASQAASQAVSEAVSEAARQAANEATTRAANEAAAEAVAGASDLAATSISDQTATSVSDRADGTSELASQRMTEQAAGNAEAAGERSGRETEPAREIAAGEATPEGSAGEPAQVAAVSAALDVVRGFDGSEVNAHEIVVLLSKADEPAIRKLDYNLVAQAPLDSLGGQILRLRVPSSVTTEAALRAIEQAAPDAVVAPNHVFRTAGDIEGKVRQPWPQTRRAQWVRPAARPDQAGQVPFEGMVGVIDTPVDPNYPGLAPAVVEAQSFADGIPANAAHGTAVAELVAEQHVRVMAANVFRRDERGGAAATTDSILRALNWLVGHHATVINMSIEGPLDGALRAAVARAQAKGCIIVAAAGNKGPAAPPSYPAAFPAVVAVTAIDRNDQIYPYANQGGYISFAALGVDVETASPPNGKSIASGTSFAAPVVAALIARMNQAKTADGAQQALSHLVKAARHLGPPGRNPVFGYGAVGPAVLITD